MSTEEFQYQQIKALHKKCTELENKLNLADTLIKRINLDKIHAKPKNTNSIFNDLFYSWKEIYEYND